MPSSTAQIGPIHFEDFSGEQFERLVYAYFLRIENWKSLEWNGQRGKDGGRDIIGVQEKDGHPDQKVCIFCANWRNPTFTKIKSDFLKVKKKPCSNSPDKYIVVFGGAVSAKLREQAKNLFISENVRDHSIYSGTEFEEHLRKNTESLLKRFFCGENFPEDPKLLEAFVDSTEASSDEEVLALISFCFDRPAFTTPFHCESYLPGFKRALTDTIEAINTGICRNRNGEVIRKIPCRHTIKNAITQTVLAEIVNKIERLRAIFDSAICSGKIKDYGGQYDETSTVEIRDSHICRQMDSIRQEILHKFRRLYPAFTVKMW